jgi:hypothetical protein
MRKEQRVNSEKEGQENKCNRQGNPIRVLAAQQSFHSIVTQHNTEGGILEELEADKRRRRRN